MKTQKTLTTLFAVLLISLLTSGCFAQKSINMSFEYKLDQARNLIINLTNPEAGTLAIYLSPATAEADMLAVHEEALKMEDWMTNTASFASVNPENNNAAFDVAEESDLELEDWMTGSFEITSTLESALAPAHEEKLELESWMSNPSSWKN
jgi:hypothetical protein